MAKPAPGKLHVRTWADLAQTTTGTGEWAAWTLETLKAVYRVCVDKRRGFRWNNGWSSGLLYGARVDRDAKYIACVLMNSVMELINTMLFRMLSSISRTFAIKHATVGPQTKLTVGLTV